MYWVILVKCDFWVVLRGMRVAREMGVGLARECDSAIAICTNTFISLLYGNCASSVADIL